MPLVLDALLSPLLKYRPSLFQQGRLAFDAPPRVAVVLTLVALGLAALVVVAYRRARADAARRDRIVLSSIRVAALLLLLGCLLRPVLVLSAAVPRRNTVAILVDDSRSMRVADQDGQPRAAFARTTFAPGSPLMTALANDFAVRVYRFSAAAERVDSVGGLTFAGAETRIGRALDRAREDLGGVPLAGVVVVSDGADGAPSALTDAALGLRARGTPVFTVGVGREALARDLEITRIDAPHSVLKGTAVSTDVLLSHTGFGGKTVKVTAEDDGRVVAVQDVTLPNADGATPVRIAVPTTAVGPRRLTVRVARQDGEALGDNNARDALVEVTDARERILYFEGEPRFEFKFLRRAVAEDANLQVVGLQRTADNKYLRLGVRDSLDLLGGFPTSRAELFGYTGIVLGSVEASAFTAEQLRMLTDFVSERGGGLLMLGGRRAFAEGGYAGTALADVLPVVLGSGARDSAPPVTELRVQLTPAGAAHPPLQLAPDARRSAERWRTLPPLTAVNVIRQVKPGATVLLTGADASGGQRIVLAAQRYGRGRAAAFPVQDSWLWQMHATIAPEDMTHELFWRQTLRWLTSDVPGQITVAASADRPAPGEAMTIRAEVRDSTFVPVNGATIVAEVTAPSGARSELPMEWGVERDGAYQAAFTPVAPGIYTVRVARRGTSGEVASSEPMHFDAGESREEYFGSAMRAPLLRRVAQETGGRFYTAANLASLPEDLRYARGGVTVVERKELWDMPIVFLLLALLIAGEWGYRRLRGLA